MKDKIQQILARIILRHGLFLQEALHQHRAETGATKHSHLEALRSDLHQQI